MSSYPKSFSYFLSRLSNFNRQKLRLATLANTDFSANDQVVLELPQGLLDMTTFTLQGYATTNAGAAHGVYLPFAEGLIDSISVEIGGVAVQNGFQNYGELFKVYKDYQMEDKRVFRRILQLENQQTGGAGPLGIAAMAADGVTQNVPFCIYNWLSFLGDVKVLDTTLLPPVKIYFRLAPIGVLTKHTPGSANAAAYRISNVRATVDILSIDDGVYYNMVSSRLQTSPLEVPFTNYTTITGTLAGAAQSTRWSTSSDCVEGIIACFKTNAAGGHAANATTGQSAYFTRSGTGVDTSVFTVNGIQYPSIPSDDAIGDVFIDTAHTLGVSQDTLGSTDASMNTLAAWKANYWVHAHSFTYPDADDSHRLCGLSGKGNQILGSWTTTGAGTNLQPLIWLKHKSVLRIGSNKQVELVL